MEKKEMRIIALPEFIKLFKESRSISTKNGRSHFLIKALGNKKWGNHVKNKREQLADAEKEVESLNFNIVKLCERLSKMKNIEDENNKHKDKLVKLYELEMIDSYGEPI